MLPLRLRYIAGQRRERLHTAAGDAAMLMMMLLSAIRC